MIIDYQPFAPTLEDPSYEEGLLVEITKQERAGKDDQLQADAELPIICLEDYINLIRRKATSSAFYSRSRKVFIKPTIDSCKHGSLKGTFACDICGSEYSEWDYLVRYCRFQHNGDHPISYHAAEIIAHGLLNFTRSESEGLSFLLDTTSPAS